VGTSATTRCPRTMGAGFADMGFTVASFVSSISMLRCSCGWGRLVSIMIYCPTDRAQEVGLKLHQNEADTVERLKQSETPE